MLHHTAVTKQLTAKWPYIANVVFQIVQNCGDKSYFVDFRGAIARSAPGPRTFTTRTTLFPENTI